MVALTGQLLVEQMFRSYQEYAALAGRELALGQDMGLGLGFYVDESQAAAMEKVRPYHDERYKWFAPFGFVRYTDSQGRPWGTPGSTLPGTFHRRGEWSKTSWLCGPPELVIDRLRDMEQKYPGLEDIILQWPEGMPWLEFKEQLTLFAGEVMPAFGG